MTPNISFSQAVIGGREDGLSVEQERRPSRLGAAAQPSPAAAAAAAGGSGATPVSGATVAASIRATTFDEGHRSIVLSSLSSSLTHHLCWTLGLDCDPSTTSTTNMLTMSSLSSGNCAVVAANAAANAVAIGSETTSSAIRRTVSEPAAAAAPTTRNVVVVVDYHCPRKFVSDSNLRGYLALKSSSATLSLTKNNSNCVTLHQVLMDLRQIVTTERLFDAGNPDVILCDPALEHALDVKAVHVTEMRDYVLRQMEEVSDLGIDDESFCSHSQPAAAADHPSDNKNGVKTTINSSSSSVLLQTNQYQSGCETATGKCPAVSSQESALSNQETTTIDSSPNGSSSSASLNDDANFDANASYCVKPPFLKLLRSIPGVDGRKTVFGYKELTNYFSRYILDNRDRLFDSRNNLVVLCREDPLGEALGLGAFHRSQVTTILRKQLIKYDKSQMETQEDSNRGQSRKRPKDGDQSANSSSSSNAPDSSTNPKKNGGGGGSSFKRQRRKSRSISVTFELDPIGTDSDDDDEEQEEEEERGAEDHVVSSSCDELRLNSPSKKNNKNSYEDDNDSSEEEEFNIGNVYSVEYEIASSGESEAEDGGSSGSSNKKDGESGGGLNGGENGNSSASDDDSDLEDLTIVASVLLGGSNDTDLAEWADSSDDSDDSEDAMFALSTYDVEAGNETWRCLNCHQPNEPFIRYCHRCWQERKGWVPERPKPKRRKQEQQQQQRKDKRTEGVSVKNASPKKSDNPKHFKRSLSSEESKSVELELTPVQVKQVSSVSDAEDDDEGVVGGGAVFRADSKSTESIGSQDSGMGSSLQFSQDDFTAGESSSQPHAEEKGGSDGGGLSSSDGEGSTGNGEGNAASFGESAAAAVAAAASAPEASMGSSGLRDLREKQLQALLCTFCCVRPKDACFVHGKISHQVCCYPCAKKLFKRKGKCPVCRRKIEKITKNIIV